MGKIFGISDLPVSHLMSPFESVTVPKPMVRTIPKVNAKDMGDIVDLPQKVGVKSNPFVKMRNGFGKLMNSIQHKN